MILSYVHRVMDTWRFGENQWVDLDSLLHKQTMMTDTKSRVSQGDYFEVAPGVSDAILNPTSNWALICFIRQFNKENTSKYPSITYYWTVPLVLDHSYLVGNLTNSNFAETKALEPLKSLHFYISSFQTC
jgi:hypothetical protein